MLAALYAYSKYNFSIKIPYAKQFIYGMLYVDYAYIDAPRYLVGRVFLLNFMLSLMEDVTFLLLVLVNLYLNLPYKIVSKVTSCNSIGNSSQNGCNY